MAATYINKEFYLTIPPAERHYMNVSGNNAALLIDRLKAENIPFSATLNGYKNTVTVRKSDSETAIALMNEVTGNNKSSRQIIGNVEYRYISDRQYINTDTQTAFMAANLLTESNIKFSGVINGDNATITVSGEKNASLVKRFIDYVKNEDLFEEMRKAGFRRVGNSSEFVNIHSDLTDEVCGFANMNVVRELFHDESNDFFNPTRYRIEKMGESYDPYYISEYSMRTGKEVNVVFSNSEFKVFDHVKDAIEFAEKNDIYLTNSSEQLINWEQEEPDILTD